MALLLPLLKDMTRISLGGLLLAALSACTSMPKFDLTNVNHDLTPARAAANIDTVRGQRALWGGVIVTSRNLKDTTQIEVLGYPLDGSAEPRRNDPPQHRFLLIHPGYLETADYAAGRWISAVGTVTGTQEGKVGEARYVYPVLNAAQLHLWPRETYSRPNEPQIHFGVGVIFGR